MAYVFVSKFFGEKPMDELLGAANENPLHITPGSSGDHVSKIQAALFAITSAQIDPDELGRSFYGTSTANAVAAFKRTRTPPSSTMRTGSTTSWASRRCRPSIRK